MRSVLTLANSDIAEVIEFVMGVTDFPVIPMTSPTRSSIGGYPGNSKRVINLLPTSN